MGYSNRETVVMALMRQGYGVEDIAVKTGLDADVIRRSFAVMRERGVIDDLYRDYPVGLTHIGATVRKIVDKMEVKK